MKTSSYDDVETFHDGEIIVREGDEGRDLRIIQSGEVIVSKQIGNQEVTLAVLERGSFFGEMSLLESLPRSATVRAKGETRVVVIRPGSLLLKIRRDPTFAFEMLQQMSRRIRYLDQQLVAALTRAQAADGSSPAILAGAAAEFRAADATAGGGAAS